MLYFLTGITDITEDLNLNLFKPFGKRNTLKKIKG